MDMGGEEEDQDQEKVKRHFNFDQSGNWIGGGFLISVKSTTVLVPVWYRVYDGIISNSWNNSGGNSKKEGKIG